MAQHTRPYFGRLSLAMFYSRTAKRMTTAIESCLNKAYQCPRYIESGVAEAKVCGQDVWYRLSVSRYAAKQCN